MTSLQTPLFRIAITIAALWTAFAGYQGWRAYEAVTASVYREGYSEETERCAEVSELAPGPQLAFVTKPNPDYIGCVERVNRTYAGYEAEERQRVAIDATKRALIPSFVMLLLAAFYRQISAFIAMIAARYLEWVKGGRAAQQHEPASGVQQTRGPADE